MTPEEIKILYDMIKENRKLIIFNLVLTASIIGEKAVDLIHNLL